jgi:hypothetical protein
MPKLPFCEAALSLKYMKERSGTVMLIQYAT